MPAMTTGSRPGSAGTGQQAWLPREQVRVFADKVPR